jgi:hypothetical protein
MLALLLKIPIIIINILHRIIPSQTHCFSSRRLRNSMTIFISLACMISFDDDKFKGIPMHLNPLFSPSVHGSSFPDQEIVNDDLIMLKDPINSIIFIKTPNHHSNVIDHAHVSNIKLKSHLVGWQVLQDGNHFFCILMGPLPLLHAFVGWQGDRHSLCIIFQFINHPSKIDDAFLYEKCHPT